MFIGITKELIKKNHSVKDALVLDISNVENTIVLLQEALKKTDTITIYDRTETLMIKEGESIQVNDHINKSGINPLIGRQNELNIDFIDMSKAYKQSQQGITTQSLGKNFFIKATYPSHYIAPITILAKAIGFKTIKGVLINKLW